MSSHLKSFAQNLVPLTKFQIVLHYGMKLIPFDSLSLSLALAAQHLKLSLIFRV